MNSLKNFTNKDQFQFHSKLFQDSRVTIQVFTALTTAELQQMMLTTLFWLLDTETKMEKLSGTSRTHGEAHGELQDISKLKEESICVLLLNAIHILSLTDPIEFKLDLLSFNHSFNFFTLVRLIIKLK